MKYIGEYSLYYVAGERRIILSIPKSIFVNKSSQMDTVIREQLFPSIHDGAPPSRAESFGDYYQIDLQEEAKAMQLVDLIEKWVSENVWQINSREDINDRE